MDELIRQIKQNMLKELKVKRAEIQAKKGTLSAQKYAEKKANVDSEIAKLDEVLDLTIKQKTAKLNEEIAELRKEVANKKANYDSNARLEAEVEAEAEVAHALRDFDIEIAKVEKDLVQ